MKRWIVYYKQRAHGSDRWVEANGVSDQHPAAFLLNMLDKFPDHESVLMWAMEVDDETTAARLSGRL